MMKRNAYAVDVGITNAQNQRSMTAHTDASQKEEKYEN